MSDDYGIDKFGMPLDTPSSQGEDERALTEAVRKIRKVGAIFMDEGGRPSVGFLLTEGQAVKELAALLRSEPREETDKI